MVFAYLYSPKFHSSRHAPEIRPRVRHGCVVARVVKSEGGRDRAETSHTGRSRSRKVRAAVAGSAAVVAAATREDSWSRRARSVAAGGDWSYGS